MNASLISIPQNGVQHRQTADKRADSGLADWLLSESAIAPEIVAERGYRRVTAFEAERFGFPRWQAQSGLLIPIFGMDGSVVSHQLRPDKPRTKDDGKPGPKYETPAGQQHFADVLPSMLPAALDANVPIAVTEGRKKGDSLASIGVPAVALTSVTTWNTPKTLQLRPELAGIPWAGRRVLLALDADAATNKAVKRELDKLTDALKALGARVEVLTWPHGKGVDDFRAQGGDVRAIIDGKPSAREIADAWDRSADLARTPDILDAFERFQRSAGVAGEGNLMRLMYLAITSRVLDRPVSFVVKGPSSGGKSYLIESTLKAFPDEAYHSFTGMSDKALLYTRKDFRHKFLYVAEAAGVSNDYLDYLLRTLLSEHRLRYETVETVNGEITPRYVEKDGPTGLAMATTRAYLHPENETRMLSLRVNDSADHTASVLLSVARRGGKDADYDNWRALQTWIAGQDNQVTIPFAETLARMIPPVDLRIRRDFELLLNAIKSHAILHQAGRELNSAGEIVATLDDYASVRGLVGDVMSAAVATRVPPQLRTIVAAVKELLDAGKKPTNRQIAESTQFSKSQVSHWLKTAKGEKYLIDANDGRRGKPADLSVGAELPADTDLLPTVEALAERWTPPVVTVEDVYGEIGGAFRGFSQAWNDDARSHAAARMVGLRRDGLRDVARDVLSIVRHNRRRERDIRAFDYAESKRYASLPSAGEWREWGTADASVFVATPEVIEEQRATRQRYEEFFATLPPDSTSQDVLLASLGASM